MIIQSCHSQSSNSKIIYDTIYVNQKKPLIKLTVDLVRVDSAYGSFIGDKMIDGIPAFVNGTQTNSRWSVEGYPHCAIFYFSKIVSIDVIRFNLYKGDKGFTNHIKLYNFSDLIYEGNIGGLLWNTIHLKFYGTAIFLEVSAPSEEPHGITNNWIDISEIEFYGYD